MRKISPNKDLLIQSSRIVLIEKSNPILSHILNDLISTQLFSTEVIPLPKNKVLVYQESIKAARFIFGNKTTVVIARVFILDEIINKKITKYYKEGEFRLNFNINSQTLSGNTASNQSFYCYDSQCQFSSLLAIPKSAKITLVKYFINYGELTIGELSLEKIPIFEIKYPFNFNNLQDGTFLKEFESKQHKYNLNNVARIDFFKKCVHLYEFGMWAEKNKTDFDNQLNKKMNGLKESPFNIRIV